VLLVHGEDDRSADDSGRILLGFLKECFAHEAVACRRENLPLQVLNFEGFFLLIDDDRPTLLGQGLGRDVGAQIKDFREAEERAFRVFERVDNVVAEGGQAGLAPEIVVGVPELARFECLRVIRLELFDVDIF
jgi:hypothetical protein